MWIALFAIPLTGLALIAAVSAVHANKVESRRSHLDLADLVSEYAGVDILPRAIAEAYSDVVGEVGHAVKRFDQFYPTLSFTEDDIYELLSRRAGKHGGNDARIALYLKEHPIFTVDDYVHFVEWLIGPPK